MMQTEMPTDRIQDYLQRLTPQARSNLLTELERLEVCGSEIPGSAAILAKLRAEFRKSGQTHNRVPNPSRYFFMPLEPLLIDGAPEHANSGRILRGSLAPIWEWINRDLLPTMARDYIEDMKALIAADNQRKAREVAATFQTKVGKYLDSTFASSDGVHNTRAKLATYTASRAAYGDLTKMLCVLRERDALKKFGDALPATIENFDPVCVSKVTKLLHEFAKNHAQAVPFALTLVAKQLQPPWQLMRLATRASVSKHAADVAATPYAITVSMVLDRLDDKRLTLRTALKNGRIQIAKEILIEIYDIEDALQSSIDLLDESDWGARLADLMNAIAVLVEAEVSRFPDNIGHVLGSRSLRRHRSLAGRLTSLAWKGRDAMRDGARYCWKFIG
jgi:flagellin-specific chaperone FliS